MYDCTHMYLHKRKIAHAYNCVELRRCIIAHIQHYARHAYNCAHVELRFAHTYNYSHVDLRARIIARVNNCPHLEVRTLRSAHTQNCAHVELRKRKIAHTCNNAHVQLRRRIINCSRMINSANKTNLINFFIRLLQATIYII